VKTASLLTIFATAFIFVNIFYEYTAVYTLNVLFLTNK